MKAERGKKHTKRRTEEGWGSPGEANMSKVIYMEEDVIINKNRKNPKRGKWQMKID